MLFSRIIPSLTREIIEDHRIVKDKNEILPKHLRYLTELTEEQKQEVRDTLLPYAEWQTKLRLHFQDIPVEELNLTNTLSSQDKNKLKLSEHIMNFNDQVGNLIKDKQRPLFSLMEFIFGQAADELQKAYDDSVKTTGENIFDFIHELKEGEVKLGQQVKTYARIYELAGQLMSELDNLYLTYPNYAKTEDTSHSE